MRRTGRIADQSVNIHNHHVLDTQLEGRDCVLTAQSGAPPYHWAATAAGAKRSAVVFMLIIRVLA
jgi:hypothetical protein